VESSRVVFPDAIRDRLSLVGKSNERDTASINLAIVRPIVRDVVVSVRLSALERNRASSDARIFIATCAVLHNL